MCQRDAISVPPRSRFLKIRLCISEPLTRPDSGIDFRPSGLYERRPRCGMRDRAPPTSMPDAYLDSPPGDVLGPLVIGTVFAGVYVLCVPSRAPGGRVSLGPLKCSQNGRRDVVPDVRRFCSPGGCIAPSADARIARYIYHTRSGVKDRAPLKSFVRCLFPCNTRHLIISQVSALWCVASHNTPFPISHGAGTVSSTRQSWDCSRSACTTGRSRITASMKCTGFGTAHGVFPDASAPP